MSNLVKTVGPTEWVPSMWKGFWAMGRGSEPQKGCLVLRRNGVSGKVFP